jgi:hypothetical protein
VNAKPLVLIALASFLWFGHPAAVAA